jgi:hypothetical protein
VHFDQVAGLWVMLGIAMVAGSALLAMRVFAKRSKPKAAQLAMRVKSHAYLPRAGSRGASFGARGGRKKTGYEDVPDV